MRDVVVSLGDRSYTIHIGSGILDWAGDLAGPDERATAAIVTDTNVAPLYADALADALFRRTRRRPAVCVMPAGEPHKRLDQVERLCGDLLKAGLDRSSVIYALGGGVVGDMAGFTASAYMRGVPYIQVPTTVLAQVDSSVGGKTGVNHPLGKNVIGSFHQPRAVLIDLETLRTLPERELSAGLAEIVKHGVIADAGLFEYMRSHASRIRRKELDAIEWPVVRSCEIKAAIVSSDEREEGARAHLNYGHTFGHAIEAVTQYGRFLHGEAVALGMQAAAALAVELGMVDEAFLTLQGACLEACGLPVKWPELPVEGTLALMKHDKKWRAGTALFILPDRLGHVIRRAGIPEKLVQSALQLVASR